MSKSLFSHTLLVSFNQHFQRFPFNLPAPVNESVLPWPWYLSINNSNKLRTPPGSLYSLCLEYQRITVICLVVLVITWPYVFHFHFVRWLVSFSVPTLIERIPIYSYIFCTSKILGWISRVTLPQYFPDVPTEALGNKMLNVLVLKTEYIRCCSNDRDFIISYDISIVQN